MANPSRSIPTPLDPSFRKSERTFPALTPDLRNQPLSSTTEPGQQEIPPAQQQQLAMANNANLPMAPHEQPLHHPTSHGQEMVPSHHANHTGQSSSSALGQLRRPAAGPLMMLPSKSSSMMHHSNPMRGDMSILLTSDDRVLSRHVEATHVPDEDVIDNVRPLFNLVQDILAHSTQFQEPVTEAHMIKDPNQAALTNVTIPNLSLIAEHISCEISCKKWGAIDAHETTMSVLRLLSHFSWEAKAVLSLAAFAISYGEFWLLAQIYNSNQLAKSMALLKQLPVVMDHRRSFKAVFDAVSDLIKAMMKVTNCIIQFKELPAIYINEDDPALKAGRTHIPIAVYWVIRSVVTAVTQMTSLTMDHGNEYALGSSTEVWELHNRTNKLESINEHLMSILRKLFEHIDAKREDDHLRILVQIFYEMIHVDNIPALTHIIVTHDPEPIYDGTSRRKVPLDALRNKNVLLLISGLDISHDELSILEQIYTESKVHAYEILWMPIISDHTKALSSDSLDSQFEQIRGTMPWYSVNHPSYIPPAFVKFAHEYWNFRAQPILVVLDSRGKVLCPNAIHMMLIWGSTAFPFTTKREEELWRDERWRLELLVDGIDQTVVDWIREGKYIFMYGGDDADLIRKFTKEAKAVAQSVGIKIEMIYVGKGNKQELVRKICAIIVAEKLSDCWQSPPWVWFFWKRIESMLYSKMELKKADDHDDIIIREVKKLLSYDKSPGGWALLSRGSEIVLLTHMSIVLQALQRYDQWKGRVPPDQPHLLPEVLLSETDEIHKDDMPCCRFEFPYKVNPTGMLCPQCHNSMEKHVSFVCCHGRPM